MVNLLKVWACQRLSLGDITGRIVFPRYLSWSLVRMRGERIKKCIECNQVHYVVYSCAYNCNKCRTANLYVFIC